MIEQVDLDRLYAAYERLPEFSGVEPLDSLRQRIGERYLGEGPTAPTDEAQG